VNADSGTDDAAGLDGVSTVLAARLRELGASVEVLSAAPAAGHIVHGVLRGSGSTKILMMIHFDTVFPRGEATRRPFKIEGSKARGPGVADAKGGVALVLHALRIARERGFSRYATLEVLFNPDEEKGSLGSRELIRKLSAAQDYVLSYEPANGERVVVATNGIALVELSVKGRAAHAAQPEKGRNAAVELAHQVVQLGALGDASKGTTVTWTLLRAGERTNVVPDAATATADMRLSDHAELARVEADAKRISQQRLIPETEVSVEVHDKRPPFSRNPATERLAGLAAGAYAELGKTLEPVAMPFGTDAGYAYRRGDAKPAVLEGLGIIGDGLHSPEEWADLASVPARLYLTLRLLELLGPGAR
jgi:glutamate carboxypeptidase